MQNNKPTLEHAAQMAALHQHGGVKMGEIQRMFPQYSRRTCYRYAKKPLGQPGQRDNRHGNRGRKPKLSQRDMRNLVRVVKNIRRSEGPNFSAARIRCRAGLMHVSTRTICRALNNLGFNYLQTRRKGLLKLTDLKKRLKFCSNMARYDDDFWTHRISSYLDAKGFQYKTNPFDQAKAPGARIWRMKSEGLEFGLTAKGSKEGATNLNFMVGISYNKGVVLCVPHEGTITGDKMAKIVRNHFDAAFKKSINPVSRRFLMDNCPRQKSKKAMRAYEKVKSIVLCIPPRSPDLNPIETFFHQMSRDLKQQAIDRQLTKETKDEFKQRVMNTMNSFEVSRINKIIETMPKRISEVIRLNGKRTKY